MVLKNIFLRFCCFYFGFVQLSATEDSLRYELPSAEFSTTPYHYAKELYDTGRRLYDEDRYLEAIPYIEKSLDVTKKENLDSLHLRGLRLVGYIYERVSEYDRALYYFNRAMEFGAKVDILTLEDSLSIIVSMGHIYYEIGDVDSLAYVDEIYFDNFRRSEDSSRIAQGIYYLAELDMGLGEYDDAIDKSKESLMIYLAHDSSRVYFNYDLLGRIYFHKKEYPKSLEYYQLSCFGVGDSSSLYDQQYCFNNYAELYILMEDYDNAIAYLEKLAKLLSISFDREQNIKTNTLLSEYYTAIGECEKAQSFLEEYINNDTLEMTFKLDVYHAIYIANRECENYGKALEYQSKYYSARDSIDNKATREKTAEIISGYKLREKQQKLDMLAKENEYILIKKEQEISGIYQWISYSALAFLSIILMIGLWMYKKLFNYNTALEEQREEIESQNQKLLKSNDDLTLANNELENFAHIASHDLKTPIRTIGSYANLFQRRYESTIDKEGKEYLGFIISGAKHMNKLLEDVLVYSKVSNQQDSKTVIDLNDLLEDVLQTMNDDIQKRNAEIVWKDLPFVFGYAPQLFQLFQNMIANALKFVEEGTAPQIKINALTNDNTYHISIKDNGIGIEKEYQEQIFLIFKRLHTQLEYEGTGIGLSICQKIVERHGGKIWVDSDGNNGTTFHFTLEKTKTF